MTVEEIVKAYQLVISLNINCHKLVCGIFLDLSFSSFARGPVKVASLEINPWYSQYSSPLYSRLSCGRRYSLSEFRVLGPVCDDTLLGMALWSSFLPVKRTEGRRMGISVSVADASRWLWLERHIVIHAWVLSQILNECRRLTNAEKL